MVRYVLRRLAQAVFVLWAAFTVTFVLLYMIPTDPVETMLGANGEGGALEEEQMAELRAYYGFDKPVWVQYGLRLVAALRGDFGNSMGSGQPVRSEIAAALPSTLVLASSALVLAVALGVGMAVLATYVRSGWLRSALLSLPPLGVAIPTFWLGLMLVQFFSFRWHLLPAFGGDGWQSVVLPAITLAIPVSAGLAQVLAQSLGATWTAPFVQTAEAKGARRGRVLGRHVLRNSLGPALAVLGMTVGGVLAGSVVTETVFSRPGIGKLTQVAVTEQDIPVVQGVVLFAALAFVVVNLVVDLVQLKIDPRVRAAPA
jgi:peptide/nickel transport system permease protein